MHKICSYIKDPIKRRNISNLARRLYIIILYARNNTFGGTRKKGKEKEARLSLRRYKTESANRGKTAAATRGVGGGGWRVAGGGRLARHEL